jgi:cation-transporting P-type ATPase C
MRAVSLGKQKPLLLCEVVHELPGRIRVRCRALRYLGNYAAELEERLGNVSCIESATVSVITSNVLIYFDGDCETAEGIREITEEMISLFSLQAYKAEREEKAQLTVNERRIQEEPISEMVTRVVVTTVSLLFAALRRTGQPAPTTFLRRFTNMSALTSISLSIPIFKSGISSMLKTLRPNADTLSATAILMSLIAGRGVSALTIIWLAEIAELLTGITMDRTRKAIREMLSLGEEFVWKINPAGRTVKVNIEEIGAGDRLVVHAGEKISVDGVVDRGEASVDQASITGEFFPVRKAEGEPVFAGTVVKNGNLTILAEKVGDETAVARIVHMVEEAAQHKASIQSFADKFSAQFIPFNFALALIVFLVTKSPTRALNMLIIDYSCGVRLSTATALSSAICTAARSGILIKGSNYLELLESIDTLILDKTGTVTEGKPQIASIIPVNGTMQPRYIIERAAAAEETSAHPMAVAVLNRVRKSGWRIPEHGETKTHVARGVETSINGDLIRVGSRRFMNESGIDTSIIHDDIYRLARLGENVIYVSENKRLLGALGVQDTLRENMKKSLNRLRYMGIDDIILLTGDAEQQAEIIASRMAMDRYEAEVLPKDKAEMVLRLQSKGVRTIMVGDGINDAPALAYADVGIAMGGTRTDIAMEAADITIKSDDPLLIPGVFRHAKKTMNIIKQNFATAIGVNTIGLVLASLGVLPVTWSAVLHNSTTILVVLNSVRLLFNRIDGR